MELDRTALLDMSVLVDGLDNTYHEVLKIFKHIKQFLTLKFRFEHNLVGKNIGSLIPSLSMSTLLAINLKMKLKIVNMQNGIFLNIPFIQKVIFFRNTDNFSL